MFFLSSVYRTLVAVGDRHIPLQLKPLWDHPAGLKTVHFWAPGLKWALVIAGIGDLSRPAEKLSIYQSTALAATGTIWARYAMVIIPKNYSLLAVNLFVGLTGYMQLFRAIRTWPWFVDLKGKVYGGTKSLQLHHKRIWYIGISDQERRTVSTKFAQIPVLNERNSET